MMHSCFRWKSVRELQLHRTWRLEIRVHKRLHTSLSPFLPASLNQSPLSPCHICLHVNLCTYHLWLKSCHVWIINIPSNTHRLKDPRMHDIRSWYGLKGDCSQLSASTNEGSIHRKFCSWWRSPEVPHWLWDHYSSQESLGSGRACKIVQRGRHITPVAEGFCLPDHFDVFWLTYLGRAEGWKTFVQFLASVMIVSRMHWDTFWDVICLKMGWISGRFCAWADWNKLSPSALPGQPKCLMTVRHFCETSANQSVSKTVSLSRKILLTGD